MTISESSISGNTALGGGRPGYGGGIDNTGTMTINNSTLSGNFGGGGIFNLGQLAISNSTLSGNSATYAGGIRNGGTFDDQQQHPQRNKAGTNGGGIFGTATLQDSIVANNSPGGTAPAQ